MSVYGKGGNGHPTFSVGSTPPPPPLAGGGVNGHGGGHGACRWPSRTKAEGWLRCHHRGVPVVEGVGQGLWVHGRPQPPAWGAFLPAMHRDAQGGHPRPGAPGGQRQYVSRGMRRMAQPALVAAAWLGLPYPHMGCLFPPCLARFAIAGLPRLVLQNWPFVPFGRILWGHCGSLVQRLVAGA